MTRAQAIPLLGFVAAMHGLTVADLTGPRRYQETVIARAIVCYLLARRGMGSSAIGRVVHRDHSSVLNLIDRVSRDPALTIQALESLVAMQQTAREAMGVA